VLEVAIRHRLGAFALDARFASGGGLTALFGRSGAGKTSIVNAIAGLLRPQYGHIAVGGTVLLDTERGLFVPPHRRRIGYVFQEGRLFPHLTVRQNLLFGHWFAPRAAAAENARFDDVVELLGIGPLLARRPGRLSGGEKQRIAIGRALLACPRLLLMDEPLASLDMARRDEILPFLERLRDHSKIPIVYVSHAAAEVARLATTIVLIADGRVQATGPVAEIMGRAGQYPLAGGFEAGAVLTATVAAHDPRWELSELAGGFGRLLTSRLDLPVGSPLRVRIRARDVILATHPPSGISALNVLPATVSAMAPIGEDAVEVELRVGAERLLARITRRSQEALGLAPGRAVFAVVKTVAIDRRSLGDNDGATAFAAEAGIFEIME
jgi:molybdate transport system ATP-binding protein